LVEKHPVPLVGLDLVKKLQRFDEQGLGVIFEVVSPANVLVDYLLLSQLGPQRIRVFVCVLDYSQLLLILDLSAVHRPLSTMAITIPFFILVKEDFERALGWLLKLRNLIGAKHVL
jgi:hypothetical protein